MIYLLNGSHIQPDDDLPSLLNFCRFFRVVLFDLMLYSDMKTEEEGESTIGQNSNCSTLADESY